MILYAAYGSNLHPLRLAERIPAARPLGTGFVDGWSLQFHKQGQDGSAKCTIAVPGNGVYVAVYDLLRTDKQKLDEIEGLGCGYEDFRVEVPEYGGCQTYLGSVSHRRDNLAPFDWYRELVMLGCIKHGLPNGYTAAVLSVAASPDPDRARNLRQWQLVDRLRDDL